MQTPGGLAPPLHFSPGPSVLDRWGRKMQDSVEDWHPTLSWATVRPAPTLPLLPGWLRPVGLK